MRLLFFSHVIGDLLDPRKKAGVRHATRAKEKVHKKLPLPQKKPLRRTSLSPLKFKYFCQNGIFRLIERIRPQAKPVVSLSIEKSFS